MIMKRIYIVFFWLIALTCIVSNLSAQTISATEIVKRTDEKFKGEQSGYSFMTMTIVRPSWQRTVEFKSWSKENDYALTLITAPAREKGQTFLKRKTEMWSWNPAINRLIKLPPSMMSQGWMGSDYTNDDILRESSVVNDYDHTIEGSETIDGHDCWKIKLLAKEDADVLWGHQVWWIDKKEYITLKAELYDEDEYLVRSENASELRMMDGRLIPTLLELIPAENEGYKTIVRIVEIKFNLKIEESFFSQQNMKTIR
jgi:outer membrane lipoprotein-sorting protein